ncbi:MAG: hypothetical protein RLN81_04590 [Balneolaceae bacterium]
MKKIIIGFFGVSLFLASCATIQTKIGQVALKFMTKKEKDFTQMAAIGMYQTNMYSPETGITLGTNADWTEGQNAVGVHLIKPGGAIGLIDLEGTVTVDGQPATSYGGGVYMALFDGDDTSTKTVRLENVDGVATEFDISPAPSISIKSINGQTDEVTLDLSEDFEIELDYNAAARGKRVRIALITKAVGVKGFAWFQSTNIQDKITVSADAFRHKHITGGGPTGKDVTKWATGENHLQVSVIEDDRSDANQPFTYFKRTSTSFDTKPVMLSGSTEGRTSINIKGDVEADNGKFKYGATSSNAWYARPLNTNIGKIGIASLSVEGFLYDQETSTSESDYGSYKVITTTTTTWQFPQLDDVYWNQFLENIYGDMVNMLEDEYGANVVDVDKITSNPIYDNFYVPGDENTVKYISKNLRDTKRLFAASLGEMLAERKTSLIADEDAMASLLRDMDMDALMNISIDYRVAGDGDDKIVLLPLVSYQVIGQTQAFDGMANTWLQGTIQGPGVSFSRSEFSDLNALNRIGQKDMIVDLIRRSIKDLTSKQAEFGYDNVWNTALTN